MSRDPLSAAAVLDQLRRIQDPHFKRDLVTLGFVKDVRVNGGTVDFAIKLPAPWFPNRDVLATAAESAVRELAGVQHVTIQKQFEVVASTPLLAKQAIEGAKNVIAVSSGKGGVGKTTVAVNLACALGKAGAKVGILDADVYGPNVPLMMGITGKPDTRGQKIVPFSAWGIRVMSMGLLIAEDQPVIWRGPMLHGAIRQFLFDVLWEDLDYLVVDLPPGTGDAQLSLSQQAHLVGAVVVTTPQDVSVLDVKKAIAMFNQVNVPILGVVENMAGYAVRGQVTGAAAGTRVRLEGPGGAIDATTDEQGRFNAVVDLFGSGGAAKLHEKYGIELLGRVPLEPRVRIGGDTGQPVVAAEPTSPAGRALMEVAGTVATRISQINLSTMMDV